MSAEPDFDEQTSHGTQILWGRVLVLLLALALAFWLGTTFGGDDEAQRVIAEQRDDIARLEAQIATMEAELAAIGAGGVVAEAPADDGTATPSEADSSETTARSTTPDGRTDDQERPNRRAARERGRRYVIQTGDSLASIAQDVYGDPTRWREIARANDLDEPYSLTVGEPLRIPSQN